MYLFYIKEYFESVLTIQVGANKNQFDARQVHRFSKMLLRDLKKFANFASALGISSFLHRKIGTLQSY